MHRGAEVAFEAIASEMSKSSDDDIYLLGSGSARPGAPYTFIHAPAISRKHFERAPRLPFFREEYAYEDLTFVAGYLSRYRPSHFDATVTCSYPLISLLLSRWPPLRPRPAHFFVTQNGDWPAFSTHLEFRPFRCDGLVCTNPDYFVRNEARWRCALIPNGIDPQRFTPGPDDRARFGLPTDAVVVVMVSALVETKRVIEGVRAVAEVPGAYVVVAGDGPLREEFDRVAGELLPGRHVRLTLPAEEMPLLYRSADVFLHPALQESFGNVYIEAAACGIPLVAHNFSVSRWIFGENHPGLVDARSTAQLADAISRAAAGGQPDRYALAVDVAERFSWSEIARQYRYFFGDVARGGDSGPAP